MEEVEAKQGRVTGWGRSPCDSTERCWAGLAVGAPIPAGRPASQGPGRAASLSCPSHTRLPEISQGALASLPWTPKAPQLHNSSISLPPPFSPLPASPATVHLLIHEALISSLFNFVLNRLTGMITTCSAVLPSPTNPVF